MPEITPVALGKLCGHPLRPRILNMLATEARSAKSVADELGLPGPAVSYHFVQLRQVGAIELVGTQRRRNAVEQFYRARGRVRIEVEPIE